MTRNQGDKSGGYGIDQTTKHRRHRMPWLPTPLREDCRRDTDQAKQDHDEVLKRAASLGASGTAGAHQQPARLMDHLLLENIL